MIFSVRRATIADVDAIAAIQGRSSWHPSTYLDYDVFVAECSGEVVGFLASRAIGGEAEILNLVIHPEMRRLGVATKLLQAVQSEEIFLEVRESNEPARLLYRKLGFTEYGERKNYYEDPRENAILMRLSSSLKRVKS